MAKASTPSCNVAALDRARSAKKLQRAGAPVPAATPAAWWDEAEEEGAGEATDLESSTVVSAVTLALALTLTLP